MMNRSNSAEAFVPSMVSFAGLEGNNQKRHLWDWATASHNLNAAVPTTNHEAIDLQSRPIFPPAPALDCPPPLFPMNHFAFCPPPPVPDFPVALIKTEDGIDSGGRIGLNLGQRTYFSSGDGLEMDHLFARSRGVYSLSHQPPRCQAEGCKADLSGAKHYHRRHKVCEFHSKATVVIAHGLQQRFCQQCSRFHALAEFDEAKRSCRKRLADHNRRRRKPQLATGIAESSASVIPTANSNIEKTKQAQDITPTKSITPVYLTGISTKRSGHLRNEPALSIRGVGADERRGMDSNTMYQSQGTLGAMLEDKFPQQQHIFSLSESSGTFFHHHNPPLSSDSNEATQSTGGCSSHSTHLQQANLLHLGQAMFELDFM
ncbi:squamosa promoter-binding-like protein 8 [Musa acuminata AAA Group]|uniref:(wild Malaysian banana) hypothetical protein n=1 Tax=Musa acuminata subsp. malaccensis TaxID=214687 RepID=A0A804HMF0_MUSAM|nr:PREDICTED: squamosa promoter-binding-like protein 8 [Musa acuminata subsp. malaccensis]CAG1835880.1 unnamed protein product [Musa acuminata subsp. malaccensis]